MPRSCYSCLHSHVCHMRIELAKQINRFKYLAATPLEVENTNAEITTEHVFAAVSRACTEYQLESAAQPSPNKPQSDLFDDNPKACRHCGNYTELHEQNLCDVCLNMGV